MDLDSKGVAVRTRSIISLQQGYVTVYIAQSLGVGDGPAENPPLMTYDGTLRPDSPSSPHTI